MARCYLQTMEQWNEQLQVTFECVFVQVQLDSNQDMEKWRKKWHQ